MFDTIKVLAGSTIALIFSGLSYAQKTTADALTIRLLKHSHTDVWDSFTTKNVQTSELSTLRSCLGAWRDIQITLRLVFEAGLQTFLG